MFINNLSPSKSATFKECRLKYKYKYINKLEESQDNTDAMQFGSFIHKVFELGVSEASLSGLEIIAKNVRDKYKFSKAFENKTGICLSNFFEFNKNIKNTISTEMVYKVLVNEKDDISFNGVIDRIIAGEDKKLLILDYKTGKNQKTKKDLYFDPQMMEYTFIAHELYKVPYKDIVVGHYYPVTNTLVTITYTEPQILQYVKKEIGVVWTIRKLTSGEFFPNRNQFCNWCGFKGICPEFTDPNKVNLLLENWPKQKPREY